MPGKVPLRPTRWASFPGPSGIWSIVALNGRSCSGYIEDCVGSCDLGDERPLVIFLAEEIDDFLDAGADLELDVRYLVPGVVAQMVTCGRLFPVGRSQRRCDCGRAESLRRSSQASGSSRRI
jgi:hypothetical protein